MHKGFTRITLGVVGAALLSGSVFATGPTFNQNLPTLIITDKAKGGSFTSGAKFDGGGSVNTVTTTNRYRYTSALDLATYVTIGTSTTANTRYLFDEHNSDATGVNGTLRTGAGRAIYVNGKPAYDTAGSITSTTVTGNSATNGGDFASDNVLSLVDRTRSGGDGVAAPGPNPGGNFTDYASLNFYVANTADATVDTKQMKVVTTNVDASNLGDRFSVSTSIFTQKACVDEFPGWFKQNSFNTLPDVSEALVAKPTYPSGFTKTWKADIAPTTAPTPTGSATSTAGFGTVAVTQTSDLPHSLGIFTNASPGNNTATPANNGTTLAPQFADWQSWRRDLNAVKTTVPVTAGKMYLIRWLCTVQAATVSATSPQIGDLRFRAGEASSLGIGQVHDILSQPGANGIVGAGQKEMRSYFYAPTGTVSGQEIGFMFDTFDFYQGTGGGALTEGAADYGVNLDKLEVYEFDRSALGSGTQVINLGGTGFTIADGSTPPASPAAFTQLVGSPSAINGDWNFRTQTFAATTDRNPTSAFAADTLSMTIAAGNRNVVAQWDTLGYVYNHASPPSSTPASTAHEIVASVPNGKLIVLDAWLSSPDGSTSNNHLPVMRVGFQSDAYGQSGSLSSGHQITQGRTAYAEFRAWNRTDAQDVSQTISSAPMGLATGAKKYVVAMEGQIRAGSFTQVDVRPFMLYWSFPLNFAVPVQNTFQDDTLDAGTIRLHRVVVTTYDLPTLPAPCP